MAPRAVESWPMKNRELRTVVVSSQGIPGLVRNRGWRKRRANRSGIGEIYQMSLFLT